MAKLIGRTKRPGKESDELISRGQEIWLWATEKPKQAAYVVGGVVGVVLLLLLSLYLVESAEDRRLDAVSSTINRYLDEEGDGPEGAAVREKLREQADQYSRYPAGGEARYFLAGILARDGEHTAAVEAYQRVMEDFSSNTNLANSAALGLAYTYRLMGEEEKALAAFQRLTEEVAAPVPQSQIRLEIGLIYEAQGKPEEARGAYRDLLESYPGGPWSEEAQQRLDLLEGA
jgi:tetratricopeptide (TPR) repeat protein